MPNYTFTRNIPNGPNNPASDQPIMQENANSTDSILNVDLYGFNDDNGGLHQKSTYVVQASDPVPVDTNGAQGIAYSKTVSGIAEIFITRFGSATPVQMTSKGISSAAAGNTFLPGGMRMEWGTVTMTTASQSVTASSMTTIYNIQATLRSTSALGSTAAGVPSGNTFTVSVQSTAIGQVVYWIVIGT